MSPSSGSTRAQLLGIALGVMLLVDAALLPGAVRRRRALELAEPSREVEHPDASALHEGGVGEDPTLHMHTPVTDGSMGSTPVGRYVAWWAVIAVFVYYYEVIARFVFNSPTNWVHESMFLMFGMQYMLCGAYAYREDQHVRVDVVYAKLSSAARLSRTSSLRSSSSFSSGLCCGPAPASRIDPIEVGEHSSTEWGFRTGRSS